MEKLSEKLPSDFQVIKVHFSLKENKFVSEYIEQGKLKTADWQLLGR